MKPSRENGHIRKNTLPTMLLFVIGPKTRESFELPRLSPITQ
jgi:hypothetical protein